MFSILLVGYNAIQALNYRMDRLLEFVYPMENGVEYSQGEFKNIDGHGFLVSNTGVWCIHQNRVSKRRFKMDIQ